MSKLRVKAAGVFLILLALSMDFTPHLLTARVLAQQEDYEAFLGRLENYLRDALPPESEPIEECEYIAPDGFDPSRAERLWMDLAPFISLGYSEQALRENLSRIYPNATIPVEANGSTVALNLTGLRVEKPPDGSIKARIPVVSDKPLNYTRFNSTNVRILYEAWNETLVKYYGVKSLLPLLNVTYRNLDDNTTITRLIKPFLNISVMLDNQTLAQGLSLNVTMPEHEQEIVTIVPEHVEEFTVLFPKYIIKVKVFINRDKWHIFPDNWYSFENTFPYVLLGGEFTVFCIVLFEGGLVFPPYEPLDAVLTVMPDEGFEVVGSSSLHFNNTHFAGMFRLRAMKTGFHKVTLKAEGNAFLVIEENDETHVSREVAYTVRVMDPSEGTALSLQVLDMSLEKVGESYDMQLTMRIECIGTLSPLTGSGGTYWVGVFELEGEYEGLPLSLKGVTEFVGVASLLPGEAMVVTHSFTFTAENPRFLIFTETVCTGAEWEPDPSEPEREYFQLTREVFYYNCTPCGPPPPGYRELEKEVAEHYEHQLVATSFHEKKMNVTVPRRTYSIRVEVGGVDLKIFESMLKGLVNGENGTTVPLMLGETLTYGTLAPLALSAPLLGLELTTSKAVEEGEARYVIQSVERLFNDLGVFNETTVCRMLNLNREDFRGGRTPNDYDVAFAYEAWVNSSKILLNSTLFAAYNQTVNNYIMENNLQGEFRLGWNKVTNATRFSEPSGETGFLTLLYHPLAVKGSGPLKSIQVRNYAGFDANYRLRVSGYQVSGYMTPVGQPPKPPLWENTTSIFQVRSLGDNVLLAGSLAPTGSGYRVQLLYGVNIVAEAFFDLYPEPSPFWTGFWDGLKGSLASILITSTIIIVTSALTGGGTAATLVGTALSIGATLFHLIGGSFVNAEQLRQGADMAMFLGGLADFYGNLSYRLSNYTPPKAPPPYGAPPTGVYKPFQPEGPLAELFWEESKAYRTASA
ncbi:MAG: hypothetical protein QXZ06_07495, partial [Candidatus Jordarchaeales archaeon]